MFKFLFGLTVVGVVVSSPATKSIKNVKIIGGEDIDITDAPYQVALVYEGDFLCGGTIVAPDMVITAAHCGCYGHNFAKYKIRVGSSSSSEGGELYSVGAFKVHEHFNSTTCDYDITVLRLSKSLEFNDRVSAIDMVNQNEEIKEGESTIITGWGKTRHGLPKKLQRVEVPVVSEESCRNDYVNMSATWHMYITPRSLCAGLSIGGKGSCDGDSGGPLVYHGKLAGIVSWSAECALPNYPDVFTKVSALRKWIDDTITHLRLNHTMRDYDAGLLN